MTTTITAATAYLDALKCGDPDQVASLLAPDASYHVNAWLQPITGREAVRDEMQRQFAIISAFDYELMRVAQQDAAVFAQHNDSFVMNETRVRTHTVTVFELAPDGLIRSVSDYWDTAQVGAQLSPAEPPNEP